MTPQQWHRLFLRLILEAQAVVLYCRFCNYGHSPTQKMPEFCPGCQRATTWFSTPRTEIQPELSYNDRKFLRAIRISAW